MSEDPAGEGQVSPDLPEPVREWLSRLAAEEDVTEEELLERLLGPAGTDDIKDRLAAVESDLADLEADMDGKLADVRERVVQVKREADAKAPADHDHAELEDRLERLADGLDSLDARLSEVDERVEEGFGNYEDVLEYLVETSEDLEGKLTTLASTVLEVREEVAALAEAESRRAGLVHLKERANRADVTRATCEACGEPVEIGLLAEPACPHCSEEFADVEGKQSFFGSPTLLTGSPPALEPAMDAEDEDLATLADSTEGMDADAALGREGAGSGDEQANETSGEPDPADDEEFWEFGRESEE